MREKTISDAGVARHLSDSDLRIGTLGLNNQLDALDGRGERLRNGTRNSSEEENGVPIFEGQLLLRHAANTVTALTTAHLSYSENYGRSQTDLDQEVLGEGERLISRPSQDKPVWLLMLSNDPWGPEEASVNKRNKKN